MTAESQPAREPAPTPRSRWRTWRTWRRGLLVALLAVGGYGAWHQYDFAQAQKEAKALGWQWEYEDPIDAIQDDWKAAFRKSTWTDGQRNLVIPGEAEFEPHAQLIRRLAPKWLCVWERPQLKDVSALEGMSALQILNLNDCTGLTNLDALKGFSALQTLTLIRCIGLTNVDALKGLPALQSLCLYDCVRLTNVDGLKGLSALQDLDLTGCVNLSAEAIAALRAALPKTKIHAPNP